MVDYTIWMIDEQDLSLTNGGLDGNTQGDGNHMVGATLTINAANWTPIAITDNDLNFQDSDSSQTLNGAQEIDGTVYSSGTRVEAEFQFEVTDGTNTWVMIGFNVNEPGAPNSYGTVEGIALIDGPNGAPPVGVPLTVVSHMEGPNYAAASYFAPICFASGTLIRTPDGAQAVETLKPGDLVETLDRGPRPVLWAGSRRYFGAGAYAPVQFAAGSLGNATAFSVSKNHRMLLRPANAEVLFGVGEVLVAAKDLVGWPGVTVPEPQPVEYHHLLLDRHEVIFANDVPSESLFPGPQAMAMLSREDRARVAALLTDAHFLLVRPELKAHEAALIAA